MEVVFATAHDKDGVALNLGLYLGVAIQELGDDFGLILIEPSFEQNFLVVLRLDSTASLLGSSTFWLDATATEFFAVNVEDCVDLPVAVTGNFEAFFVIEPFDGRWRAFKIIAACHFALALVKDVVHLCFVVLADDVETKICHVGSITDVSGERNLRSMDFGREELRDKRYEL